MSEMQNFQDTPQRPGDMLTASGFAVGNGDLRWYIAECKPTKEKLVRTMLQKANYEVYVASRVEERIYANRTRHTKEAVLISGKVFVRTTEDQLMPIMLGYSSVWRFMMNRAAQGRSYAFVSDQEMQQLQYILGKATNPVHITADSLKVNQRIKVMRGALAGLEGWYYKEGHASYVVIKFSMGISHYVFTEIPIDDIQLL